uniref:ATP-binding cassette transporter subfamily B member 1 X2 n=1 Tax=Brachionus plicatilis TaxID=10195 RepID=A0A7H9SQJ8_BRAPC|nr:ATP-binding cassette transporter subfamily B member 1 X2 [Brachionus plicatilis]
MGIEKIKMTSLKKPKSEERKEHKKEKNSNIEFVSFFGLFRYGTKIDLLFMLIGTIGAVANGVILPYMMLVFSNIIDGFTDYGKVCNITLLTNTSFSDSDVNPLTSRLKNQIFYLIILGIATMILSYFQVAFWLMPAQKQARAIRKALFSSILKQDIGWFDVYKSGELTNRLTDDIDKIKDAFGDKFGNAIQNLATFVGGIVIGFVKGWKLTLVILSLSPLILASAIMFTKIAQVLTSNELKSYAKAGAVAEEVFSAIRTVFAFNGAQKEHKRYEEKLDEAKKYGIKKATINGLLMGFIWIVINGAYALGFWYGWTLSLNNDPVTGLPEYSIGKILLVFFSIIIAIFSLGNAGPYIGTSATGRGAAFEVFKIIDRKPTIDTSSEEGNKPVDVTGNIEFNNVNFNYPSRPDINILNGLDLRIKHGSTVALVGSSGCGKSTCIQLIQRFYDPLNGSVKLDGNDLRSLNVKWLRSQIGVVNQEPILFSTTIKENIRFGQDDVTDEQIIEAAKNANAHEFIMSLPEKYDTKVGDRGGQLSGGQKQRIAIARALVRNPKVLLLDEATSALDNESESIVQAALDKARLGRTTIIVAHRLSTILNADIIFAFESGKVKEFGTHADLMSQKGLYYKLVVTQQAGMKSLASLDKINPIIEEKSKLNVEKQVSIIGDKLLEIDLKVEEIKKKEKKKDVSMFKVLKLNAPEWYFILIGCLASIISGAVQPAFSIVFSKAIAIFSECDVKKQEQSIILYSILFIVFGVATFISNLLQNSMFGISGENLTKRLRSKGFKTMLKQDIAWFDNQENSVGILCTKLAVEAAAVQGAAGIRIGALLMNLGNLGIGLVLALVYGWAIALTILAFVPFMIVGGVLQTKMLTGFSGKDKEVLQDAGKISIEAISNIRTVAILNKEYYFWNLYSKKLDVPYKAAIRSSNISAFMLGFTSSITFYAMAAAFALGSYLVENNLFGMTFENIMLVYSCIIFGAQSVGQASSLMPDYAKAKTAVNSMFELFERQTKVNNYESTNGITIEDKDFKTDISLESVEFCYPSRPDAKILKGLDLKVKEGQRVAFVGSSGCGKSTVTQLLERFYDPDNGTIKLNDINLNDYNLHWLRSKFGIVSQEPILFDMSIHENIAYGDNSRQVTREEVIEAAKKANIHDFISNLPLGYETNVGSKGTQLSGGQKQRVAIARALVRDPKILLLDEATSALDTESEKIVQDALDRAQQGRTCIVIAHRLSTIRDSDVIYVLQNGIVTEMGSHEELMNLGGFYAKLNKKS